MSNQDCEYLLEKPVLEEIEEVDEFVQFENIKKMVKSLCVLQEYAPKKEK